MVNDFQEFCKLMRPTYKWSEGQAAIIEKLNTLPQIKKNGHDYHSAIIEGQLQTGKTEICARLLIPYVVGKFSEWDILYMAHNEAIAKEVLTDVLDLMNREPYKEIFPDANCSLDGLRFCGIESVIGGYAPQLIILDNIISSWERKSEAIREKKYEIGRQIIAKNSAQVNLIISTSRDNDMAFMMKEFMDPLSVGYISLNFNTSNGELYRGN